MALKEGTANRILTLYAPLLIGVLGLVGVGISDWDVLEKRHVTLMSVLSIITWVIGVLLVAWSTYLNLRDAKREKLLRVKVITLEDDCRLRIDVANHRLEEALAKHAQEMESLCTKHELEIIDHRRVVVHRAYWGMGGLREMYSDDVTGLVSHYIRRGSDFLAADEHLGSGKYPGDNTKHLRIRFSCSCSAIPLEHRFDYGNIINQGVLEALCPKT